MNTEEIIAEIKHYESDLSGILGRFTRTRNAIYIGEGDDPLFRQIVHELIDLFNDILGPNSYSQQIVGDSVVENGDVTK